MHVHVDEELCQGTGYCARVAPEVFEVRDGIAHLRTTKVDSELDELVQEAESLCPSRAISL